MESLILAFLCLCVVGGQTSAQVNLLPQGDFKNPGANTEWAEGFNIPQNQEIQVISENGKSRLRIEDHDAGRQLDYVHAYVKVTSEIESLTISARMKATNLKVGTEGRHDTRVAINFEGSSSSYDLHDVVRNQAVSAGCDERRWMLRFKTCTPT